MEPTTVQSTDDILSAADARLNAPEPEKPAKSTGDPVEPPSEHSGSDGEDGGESEAGGTPPAESTLEVDGEHLTPSQIRVMKRDAARVKEAEKAQRAAQYLLQHPEEYERVRRESGMAPATPPEPKAAPVATGPDPIDDPRGWKYVRFGQYVDYLNQRGQTATHQDITNQVEQDHVQARTERMHEVLLEERATRKRENADREQQQAAWRQDQEANQIAKTLTPLFEKYPQAASLDGQEEVEARIIRAVHLNQPVDYEKIVRSVHERNMGVVKKWAQDKKAMGAGTGAAVARGGSAQGSRQKLKDRMPADISSITEYAERASRGET